MPAIIRFLGYNPFPPKEDWAARLVQCRNGSGTHAKGIRPEDGRGPEHAGEMGAGRTRADGRLRGPCRTAPTHRRDGVCTAVRATRVEACERRATVSRRLRAIHADFQPGSAASEHPLVAQKDGSICDKTSVGSLKNNKFPRKQWPFVWEEIAILDGTSPRITRGDYRNAPLPACTSYDCDFCACDLLGTNTILNNTKSETTGNTKDCSSPRIRGVKELGGQIRQP